MLDLLKLQKFDLDQKLLNKVYYPRAYKRGYPLNTPDYAYLDTGGDIILNNNRLCPGVVNKQSGSTVDLSYRFFEHKKDFKLRFLQHVAVLGLPSNGLLSAYKKQLDVLSLVRRDPREIGASVLLLHPIKGGFRAFSCGLIGFYHVVILGLLYGLFSHSCSVRELIV